MAKWKIAVGVVGVAIVAIATTLYVTFGAFLPWRENDEVARLATLTGVRSGQHIAEIGAGGGRFSLALARIVGPQGHVYATEVSEDRLADLRTKAQGITNLSVIEATTTETRLPDGCCDLILMRAMYHHVGEPESFLQAVARALKPGGRVVVIDFGVSTLWFDDERPDGAAPRRTGHGVSQSAVADEFRAAGFTQAHSNSRWSGPLWLSVFVRP